MLLLSPAICLLQLHKKKTQAANKTDGNNNKHFLPANFNPGYSG